MTKNHKSVRWRRIFVCCHFFLSISLTLSAQDLLVSGKVTDGNLPISGANVIIKNTTNGVVTDFDGRYTITARPTDTLQISYLGYTTLTFPIHNRSTINVTLQEDATALGEVQINAGYYTTTDREKTGSIARITAKDIEGQPVNNALEALQGRVTGLDIVPTTGLPGGGYTVRIRGQNSIAAGNDPLYVVDGVPYDNSSLGSQTISGTILKGGSINPLNTLDPSSIASIEVLKDADATAIYGSRGANGVILITTKKGKVGKTTFHFDASTTAISVTKMRDLLNTEQYLNIREEAFANDGFTEFPETAYDINGTWDRNRYTDWQKKFIGNTALNNSLKLAVSGGNEQTRFRLGSSFMKETTVFPFDFNYNRATFYANTSHTSKNERFNLQFSANFGLDNNHLPSTDLTYKSINLSPNAPKVYDAHGNLNWENSTWNNPYAELESNYKNNTHNLTANAVLSYQILDGWSLKSNFGYTEATMDESQANPSTRFNPAWGVTSASSNFLVNESKRESWIIEPQFDGEFKVGTGVLKMTLGGTLQEQNFRQLTYYGFGYASDQLLNSISAAQNVYYLEDSKTQYCYLAAYARLNYNHAHKYIINLTGRRDGSSRFGPNNRFANFGAIGAAWMISQENFAKNLSWLSFAKLRTSFGITGNDQIGDYQYLRTYTVTDAFYDGSIGLVPTRLFNPEYAWEGNKKMEFALEAGILNNRIQLEVAYYHNRSDNQLLGLPLPSTTGFNTINANLDAVIDNKGWELGIQSKNISNKNFEWETSFQITVPKTELTKFDQLENSTYANILSIGYPMNISKLYHITGVNTETGVFDFEDYNDDGVISPTDDKQYIADLTPKFFGNITNSLRYRNLNLNLSFQYVKKMGYNEIYGTQPPGTMFNQPISVLQRWQMPGDQSEIQQVTTGANSEAYLAFSRFGQSNGVISDASFLRLKSIALSYKLPIKNNHTPSVNLYVQAQNLFTITKFKGGDPEQSYGFLPPVKRISIGVNIEL